jgi:Amino acid permease
MSRGSRLSRPSRPGARELAHGAIGSARVTAFGVSNVAPAGAVAGGLVIVVGYAGFAAPLVVLIALVASLCCAVSIAEFARRLPSAGSLYTYNSHGLGRAGGFLTGWMMVFAYALYLPAGIVLTSAYASQLVADTLHVAIAGWALFVVILAAVASVACLGIGTSSWVDLALVAGEVAVIAALAVSILVKVGPAHYSAAVLWPASSPGGQLTGITNAMIYGITAFAGYETAAALGEEARNARRSIPASTIGIVIVTGLFYALVICAETWGVGRHGILSLTRQHNPLGYLTSRYWSPSALWVIDLVVVLTGLGFVTAVIRFWRHLLVPATATVFFLFPLWGILHPHGRTLMDLLPFTSIGWLFLGVIAASALRARRPVSFETLGRVFAPAGDDQQMRTGAESHQETGGFTPARVTTFHDSPAGWSEDSGNSDPGGRNDAPSGP